MSQDGVNAVWLVGLLVFFYFLFRVPLGNLYQNLRSGNWKNITLDPPFVLTEQEDCDLSYRIGMVVGTMGGTTQDAAIAKFALLRSKKAGDKITDQDIARAVAMTLGSRQGG